MPSHSPTRAAARPATRRRRTTRCLLLLGVVVLYAISIPWYRSDDQPLRLWLGFPDWVTTALLCYFAAAALNFAAWHLTEIPEPESDGDGACETDA